MTFTFSRLLSLSLFTALLIVLAGCPASRSGSSVTPKPRLEPVAGIDLKDGQKTPEELLGPAIDRLTEAIKTAENELRNLEKPLPPGVTTSSVKSAEAQLEQAKSDKTLALGVRSTGRADRALSIVGKALARTEVARAMLLTSPEFSQRAVWWRLQTNVQSEIKARVAKLAESGFDTINLEVWYQGQTIYPSGETLLPQHSEHLGGDPLEWVLNAAREHQMKVNAWVRVYRLGRRTNSPILQERPAWVALNRQGSHESRPERGTVFLTPFNTKANTFVLENLRKLVQLYGIDGLILDDLRIANSLDPQRSFDYSNSARQAFYDEFQADPKALDPATNPDLWAEWEQYRQDQITHFLEIIREEMRRIKPEMKLAVKINANAQESQKVFAQDWILWADAGLADLFYTDLATMDAQRLRDEIVNVRRDLPSNAEIIVGLPAYLRVSSLDLARLVLTAADAQASGVVFRNNHDLDTLDLQTLQYGVFRTEKQPIKTIGSTKKK